MSRSAAVENARLLRVARYRESWMARNACQSSPPSLACRAMPYPLTMRSSMRRECPRFFSCVHESQLRIAVCA